MRTLPISIILLLFTCCDVLAQTSYNIPGYALSVSIPMVAEQSTRWYGELDPSVSWARFAVGYRSGRGDGDVIIRIAANPSSTDTRTVTLYINGKPAYTLIQDTYESSAQWNICWWYNTAMEETGGYYDTALYAEDEPGMGWVYSPLWPYIYSYSLATWLYVTNGSDAETFYAYRFDHNNWLWGNMQWGWYYDFATGWGRFNDE